MHLDMHLPLKTDERSSLELAFFILFQALLKQIGRAGQVGHGLRGGQLSAVQPGHCGAHAAQGPSLVRLRSGLRFDEKRANCMVLHDVT